MNWTTIVALGLFGLACLAAVYQSRTEDWNRSQNLGTGIFFVGAAIGMFLDDLVAADSPAFPFIEPIGAGIAVLGLVLLWFRYPE